MEKSIVGGIVMIRSMFGLLSLCMGRKSERSIVRLLSLFTCTKSTKFYGIHVGVFVIGAKDAFRLLLLLLLFVNRRSKGASWSCQFVEALLVFPREGHFGARVKAILHFLNFLHCNMPNVFIVMLPFVMSI